MAEVLGQIGSDKQFLKIILVAFRFLKIKIYKIHKSLSKGILIFCTQTLYIIYQTNFFQLHKLL